MTMITGKRLLIPLAAAWIGACAPGASDEDIAVDHPSRASSKRLPSATRVAAARMSRIAAVSRAGSPEIYWISALGEVRVTARQGDAWAERIVAGPHSAVPWGGLAAVSRSPQDVMLFWIGRAGTVEVASVGTEVRRFPPL